MRIDSPVHTSPSASVGTSELSVYYVCMARINVYLPDELADQARKAELNVSAITQAALADALATRDMRWWLSDLAVIDAVDVPSERVRDAIDAGREDFGL